MKIVYIYRSTVSGNYSMEELFEQISASISFNFNVEVVHYVYNPSKSIFQNVKIIKAYNADVYHITGAINYLSLFLPRSKTILTVHDLGHWNRTLKGWRKWIYYWIWLKIPFNWSRRIICISDFTYYTLKKYVDIGKDKIRVIPNPLSSIYKGEPLCKPMPFKPLILQIGSGHNKNIEGLINAVQGLNIELLLVRKPDTLIQTKLQELGIAYQWKSYLTAEEVRQCYMMADILFFASFYEGFGMPIIEAQACGCPVITSTLASMPEVAGEGALLVDPLNPAEIRRAIISLIQNETKRLELINLGFVNCKRFDLNITAKHYYELYLELQD